jgi:hypothetical protein
MVVGDVVKGLLDKFRKKSIEKISLEDLRKERIRVEQEQNKLVRSVDELQKQKEELFLRGSKEPSARQKVTIARRIKELDTQVGYLDANLNFLSKQFRIMNGLINIKMQKESLESYGLSSLLSSLNWTELESYIEKATVQGEFQMEKFRELLGVLEEAVPGAGEAVEEDIAEIVKAMETSKPAEAEKPEEVEKKVREGMKRVDEILHPESPAAED